MALEWEHKFCLLHIISQFSNIGCISNSHSNVLLKYKLKL
nr:MAG TPA: hypothetical protein [Bacteriophage sp.]